jgi:hypothetical protein
MARAATIKKHEDLPDEARTTAALIKRLGFDWELDQRYPTPDLDKRVQVREEKHYAPTAEVTKYAAAYQRGEPIPPIVVTTDGYLLDGNTRVGALHKAKQPTVSALIVNDAYEGAEETTLRRFRLLGAAFNARHGRGIDRVETTNAILAVVAGGDYTAERIATLLGVSSGLVSAVVAEQKARERAQRLGVHVNGSVPISMLRRLGQAPLNDEPFLRMLKLVQDAGLSSSELGDLVRQVKAAGSDEKALELIDNQRVERKTQIAEYQAFGKSKPPGPAQLRQHLGFVLKHTDDPKALVDHNPTTAAGHIKTIDDAIAVLTKVRALQGEGGS